MLESGGFLHGLLLLACSGMGVFVLVLFVVGLRRGPGLIWPQVRAFLFLGAMMAAGLVVICGLYGARVLGVPL